MVQVIFEILRDGKSRLWFSPRSLLPENDGTSIEVIFVRAHTGLTNKLKVIHVETFKVFVNLGLCV